MPNSEIYIATAVETDGPIPGPNSLLSLASAAYQRDQTLVSSFTVNLETLPGAKGDPDTLAWWKSKPEAWAVCRHEPEPIRRAMHEYADWLRNLPGSPVYVGHPAAAGYMFVTWYLHNFVGSSPFGRGALDLRTLAMTLLQKPYRGARMRYMPGAWVIDSPPRTYVALDDALSVGRLMCHMFEAWKTMPRLVCELPSEHEVPLRLEE
ncbi:MAG: exonuclease [Planctomycetota bacterium]